jgi:DNA polymerase-3 subunit epsilon
MVSAAVILDDPTGESWQLDLLVDPGVEIPLEATAVHGISTEAAIRDGQPAADGLAHVIDAFQKIQASYNQPIPVVIFNATFDLTILDRELGRHLGSELDLTFPVIDPLVCDRALDPYRPGRRTLTATAAAHHIAIQGAHTALGDVLCSVKLARALATKHPQLANANFGAMKVFQKTAYKDWADGFSRFHSTADPAFEPISTAWPLISRANDAQADDTAA